MIELFYAQTNYPSVLYDQWLSAAPCNYQTDSDDPSVLILSVKALVLWLFCSLLQSTSVS